MRTHYPADPSDPTRSQLARAAFERAVAKLDRNDPQAALVQFRKLKAAYDRRRTHIELASFLTARGLDRIIRKGALEALAGEGC